MPPDHRRAAFCVNARGAPILYLSVDARAQDDPILYLSVDARAQEIAELGAELSAGGISISHPII